VELDTMQEVVLVEVMNVYLVQKFYEDELRNKRL
jgi:hypothetical protein